MLVLIATFADMLSGWEGVLILAVILILFGAKQLPKIRRGLGGALSEIRKQFDQGAHDTGKSLGGIYGRPAAEALTPDNQTAELYNPAVFHDEERTRRAPKQIRFRRWRGLWRLIWYSILKRRKAKI